ncbi:MAG: VOC family protein [Acidimicrobiales bacterium]|nr:VOC family protein [Acidimicrobiales bacterium]
MREQGVNRVVMLVRDLDAGRAFYEKLLGCTFHSVNDEEAAAFGVRTVFSWDGGIELVAPLEGKDSHLEKILESRGEGLIGVVWAVPDADAAKVAGEELGVGSYYTLDYSQDQIDRDLQGRFTRYYQHFLSGPETPLGPATVLVGEFDRDGD